MKLPALVLLVALAAAGCGATQAESEAGPEADAGAPDVASIVCAEAGVVVETPRVAARDGAERAGGIRGRSV